MLPNHQELRTCDNRIGNVMSNFTRVEGHQDLVRDNNSGAIINRNRSAYEIAKRRAQMHRNKEMKLEVQLVR